MSTTSEGTALEAWPSTTEETAVGKNGAKGNGRSGGKATKARRDAKGSPGRRQQRSTDRRAARRPTTTTTSKTGIKLSEYGQYRELFYNLTMRELRSKYKRSVIGWGWSMINPLAMMMIYTIVFAVLLKTPPLLGEPSGLHVYALMLLTAMLPWNFFQGSVMESMGALLGNQNLIQKTYFPRELIPGATVASKLVSHIIEMSLLVVVIVAFGNWRALPFLPAVIVTMIIVSMFALGLALLFSLGNVFYRDIQHFSNILFFIWMFLTPMAYPFSSVGGGLTFGSTGTATILNPRTIKVLGHVFSLGTIFKLNPMTDAVLVFQSFIYDGTYPGSSHYMKVAVSHIVEPHLLNGKMVGAQVVYTHIIQSNVSWGDFAYLAAWAVGMLALGMWVFRKYESRLPEEL
jgi:lipopolysaccharide transport system permease protein